MIRVLASGHERPLEGPPAAGAGRRGPGDPQEGRRGDLLCFVAHHEALAEGAARDRRGGGQGDPRAAAEKKGAALLGRPPQRLASEPDETLAEHRGASEEEAGTRVSAATMRRAIARLPGGWPLKKSAP